MIAMRLRHRLEQLEVRHTAIDRVVKQMLPSWLLAEYVKRGALLDAEGRLDLSYLQQIQRQGGSK
jgi:hypothetical protein